MKTGTLEILEKVENTDYKKYKVEYKGKEGIIYYYINEVAFEIYCGNFSETDFEDIKKELFEDAYYNIIIK